MVVLNCNFHIDIGVLFKYVIVLTKYVMSKYESNN